LKKKGTFLYKGGKKRKKAILPWKKKHAAFTRRNHGGARWGIAAFGKEKRIGYVSWRKKESLASGKKGSIEVRQKREKKKGGFLLP